MTLLVGAAVTWVTGGEQDHYGPLFLLPVLATGALLGRGPAVLASLLSFLAFNWFFVPPIHTLTVADAEDWQGLLTSLAVALVTGELTSRLRARADDANRRQREAIALQEVGQALSAATSFDEGLAATERSLRRVLGDVTLRLVLASESPNTESLNKEVPDPAVTAFPLASGGRPLGALHVTGRGAKLNGEEHRLLTSAAGRLQRLAVFRHADRAAEDVRRDRVR
jgi:K+-sensing histidine kinase KdpD